MPMNHLMLGLLGGIAALAVGLAAGGPLWLGALLFLGVGNGLALGSLALWLVEDRRDRRTAQERRRAAAAASGRRRRPVLRGATADAGPSRGRHSLAALPPVARASARRP